jgi:hypothetical protein
MRESIEDFEVRRKKETDYPGIEHRKTTQGLAA